MKNKKKSWLDTLKEKGDRLNLKTPVPSVLTFENIGFLSDIKSELMAISEPMETDEHSKSGDYGKLSRDAFETLSYKKRAEFIRDGGHVFDVSKDTTA